MLVGIQYPDGISNLSLSMPVFPEILRRSLMFSEPVVTSTVSSLDDTWNCINQESAVDVLSLFQRIIRAQVPMYHPIGILVTKN